MALAIDSQESGNAGHHAATPATTLSWSFTNTAGNLLIVGANMTAITSPAFSTVTYNGVSMTQVPGSLINISGTSIAALFYLLNPATGSNTVQITTTGTSGVNGDMLGAAISLSGAASSTPVGNASQATGNSASASVSVAGTTSGDYVVSYVCTGTGVSSAAAPTVLSASLNVSGNTSSDNMGLGEQSTSGGSVNAGFNVTSDLWAITAAEVFAASSTTTAFPDGRTIIRVQQPLWR